MEHLDRRTFLTIAGGTLATAAANRSFGAKLALKHHGLVVGHPEAAAAGNEVLGDGGNAIDAVVAAALVAGVVGVSKCGIGGYGGHMTIGLPSGKVTCIDFNTEAPKAASPDMFPVDKDGNVKDKRNWHGWLAAGVPATMAGLQMALDKYGTLPFARLVQPAIRHAREGFAVYWPFDKDLAKDPATAKLFLKNGKPLKKGDHYRNPDLADLLQHLAEKGSAHDFYQGEVGRRIADAFKKNGGLVTAEDMASYRPLEIEPVVLDWRGHTIATAPLTAGGLTILQIIATIKALGRDWERLAKDDPVRTHTWLESMRIAWGDRLQLFGDPQFVDVPVERLLSEKYGRKSAAKVRTAVKTKKPVPVGTDGRNEDGTVNLAATDSSGLMVCLTLTHGNSFGAEVTVDGLGLLLGHGMSRFDPVPGRLNSIAPGKRPLDNMCPTIVLRNGKPLVAIGGVGGRRIPNAVFQTLLKLIDDGSSLEQAVAEPRIHTTGGTWLNVESSRPEAELNYLKTLGYKIEGPQMSWVAAVEIDPSKKGRPAVGVADYAIEQTRTKMREPRPKVARSG